MKLSFTRCLTALLLFGLVGTASANQWPHTGAPDSLTVFQIHTGTAGLTVLGSPNIAVPDTVWGVRGVVTAFDANPTGFSFYIQDPSSNTTVFENPWTGIDCFSGGIAKNCQGLAIGDYVVVYGKVQAFQGLNEIEGFDNVQATDDLIVRTISHNAVMPGFHTDFVSVLKEVPQAAPAGADSVREKWEGMLVKVNGPLRVARNSLTGGLVTFSSYLVVDNTVCPISSVGPCDSMFIDGSTLANIFPPSVGTILNGVQGVYGQATRGYRIQLRNGNDQIGSLPPNVIDAYSLGNNVVQLNFDRDLDPVTAQDVNNYYDGALRTPLSAVIQDPNTVNVTFDTSTGPAVGQQITVNCQNIESVDLTVNPNVQTRFCVNGIISIMDIQAPSPDSLVAFQGCKDVSKYITTNFAIPSQSRLTFRGVCTGGAGSSMWLEDASQAQRSGLLVFAPQCALNEGHQYLIAASVNEFGSGTANLRETETSGTQYVKDEGAATPITPFVSSCHVLKDNTCDATQTLTNGEDYEQMLVTVPYVKVIRTYPGNTSRVGGGFVVQDLNGTAADTLRIDNGLYTGYKPVVGDVFDITGNMPFFSTTATSTDGASNAQFRIALRKPTDLLFHGNNVDVQPRFAGKLAMSVSPNPSRNPIVSFTLPNKTVVEVGVYDVQGRKLRTLANGVMEAGTYTRMWDGRDASGQPVGSGVYFYRMRAGGETLSTRNVKVD